MIAVVLCDHLVPVSDITPTAPQIYTDGTERLEEKVRCMYDRFLPEEGAISLSFYSALAPAHEALK